MTFQPLNDSVRAMLAFFGEQADWHYDSEDLVCLEIETIVATHPNKGLSSFPDLYVNTDNLCSSENGVHVFHFGAYGDTHVLAFGTLEDALEDAAATLLKVAPGLFAEPDYAEAAEELGLALDTADDEDEIREHAEVDLTYTEAGWLVSHEWTVTSFDSIEEARDWLLNR